MLRLSTHHLASRKRITGWTGYAGWHLACSKCSFLKAAN
jgi:hypothetical protein